MMKLNPLTLQFPEHLEPDFLKYYYWISLRHGRIGLMTVIFLFLCFGILDGLVAAPDAKSIIFMIRYVVVCPFLLATFFFSFSRHFQKFFQVIWSLTILVSGCSLILITVVNQWFQSNPNPAVTEVHVSLILTLIYAYTFVILRFIYGTVVSLSLIIAYDLAGLFVIHIPPLILLKNNFYVLAANFIGMFASYQIELYIRTTFFRTQLWEAEQEKSDRLLKNILPQPIAEQLKQGNNNIAENFAEVTVLFADIAGFTSLSTRIPPLELVNLLNQIFSVFDELAERHGLEKIKTIGDAYMVVGGLPEHRLDHAQAMAEMALDMQTEIAKFRTETGEPFSIRIGINSGPVVAGVIGIRKFIYDLWGDTVNTASRMESHGIPGHIQVTASTYEILRDQYLFEERGIIEVKGKGTMQTYWLTGRLAVS